MSSLESPDNNAYLCLYCLYFAATNDIQHPKTDQNHNGTMIVVTGELIKRSSAKGAFLVIVSNSSPEITFITLKRNGANSTLFRKVHMPPSRYTVFVHDLEENSVPSPHPANLISETAATMHIKGSCEPNSYLYRVSKGFVLLP